MLICIIRRALEMAPANFEHRRRVVSTGGGLFRLWGPKPMLDVKLEGSYPRLKLQADRVTFTLFCVDEEQKPLNDSLIVGGR